MAAHVSVSVHPDPEAFRVVEFPESATGPFVSLEIGGNTSLLVHDPADLAALAALAIRAQVWLTAALAGQDALPDATQDELEPVGQTGLTLHALPVGVS